MTISDPVAVEPEVRLRRNTARAGRGDNLLSARAALALAPRSAAECARRLARRLELRFAGGEPPVRRGAPADDWGDN
jgi:hypothetical protein